MRRYPTVWHGTPQGYDKHRRTRKGRWSWPACDKCMAARQAYNTEVQARPQYRAHAGERSKARQRALARLRERHPGEYMKFYAEELSLIRDGGVVVLENLQAQLRQVTAGVKVSELEQAVRAGSATLQERALYFQVRSLRKQAAEAGRQVEERRAEQREPAAGC